jgi:molybdate transport system ATP-binding protein
VETTLTGVVRGTEGDLTEVECAGATLLLPMPDAEEGDRAYLTVSADEVLVAAGEPPRTSARNTLTGRVDRIVDRGTTALVAVKAGPVIWAEVTLVSVRGLGLAPGREVHLLIKATSLRGVALRSWAGS